MQRPDSRHPPLPLTRRRLMGAALGSGFAAAVLPVGAQTIRTDSAGLTVGEVLIAVGDFRMPAYRAMPEGRTHLPVVLVVSEIFGVHEHIADVARRFARLGYLAIAPELFERQGDPQSYGEIDKLWSEVVAKASDAQVLGDLDATVAWAALNGGDTSRLGATGFCWGGRITWMFAAHSRAVKAGVVWYGSLARAPFTGDKTALEVAAQITAPMLGLYGAADEGIPNDTVEAMRAALKAAGNTRSRIVSYAGTPHAFHADYRSTYRKAAADDGWKRCLAWFRANGVA